MPRYLIEDHVIDKSDPFLSSHLATSYVSKMRPLCICRTPGIEMYIAKHGDNYLIKRMPNSGHLHHPDCESFCLPSEFSGRGELDNKAIMEDQTTGDVKIKLDFSLAKMNSNRAVAQNPDAEASSVKSAPSKMSIRSLLHFLYEEAGLNRWSPKMQGKRNWFIIKRYLSEAAHGKYTKNRSLTDILWIPDVFKLERKEEIQAQTKRFLKSLDGGGKSNAQSMGIVVGEMKTIEPARFGYRLKIKHLPDTSFYMQEDTYKRIYRVFPEEMSFFEEDESTHLMVIATFYLSASSNPQIETFAAMIVDSNWLPFEKDADRDIIDQLTKHQQHFIKPLRYNLKSSDILASALVTSADRPIAVYGKALNESEEIEEKRLNIIEDSEYASLVIQEDEVLHLKTKINDIKNEQRLNPNAE